MFCLDYASLSTPNGWEKKLNYKPRLRRVFGGSRLKFPLMVVSAQKSSQANPYLHRINPRIRDGQACVRYMRIANFGAPVIFSPQKVRAQRRRRSEIYVIRSGRNIVIREQNPSAQF